jgi:hypothetical protein
VRVFALILLFVVAPLVVSAAPKIDPHNDSSRPFISADLTPDIAEQLSKRSLNSADACAFLRLVRLNEKTGAEGPPIFGSYSLTGATLHFVPQFPLSAGEHYRAVLSLPGQKPQLTDYSLPAAAAAQPPHVVKIYPSSDTVPANLLKFYIYFSQPVRQSNQIFDQLHILDESGKAVYDPWRRFQQWSDDGKRLTLWIHPGRVKQGVNLREDFGAVLQPGQKYTLVIDAEVSDLAGRAMEARFEKRFTAAAEDRERLSLDKWDVKPPRAGTREPLLITFPRPLDHALMQRLIAVRDDAGKPVEGRAEAGDGEKTWSFRPDHPWSAHAYTIIAHELLEDLAGNTPARVFDSDMQQPETRPGTTNLRFIPK